MEKGKFVKYDFFLLAFILIVSLLFRLYRVDAPLSDAYSWRQADTAAVARNFVRNGFTLFMPKYDDLSSIQSGQDNPDGLRFVEFPIYNALMGLSYLVLPTIPIEIHGRLISILFSLITLSVLYYLLLKEHSRLSAVIGSAVFGMLPAFVFFSRVVLPEPTAVGFMFLSIFLLYIYHFKKTPSSIVFFMFSLFCFSVSILIKPTVIFYGLGLLYLFYRTYGLWFIKKPAVYIYFILALIPFVLWRGYIAQYPQGIPSSDWLITSVNTFEGQKNIFFKPAFFRWIFYERINLMIFGGFLTGFFVYGIFIKSNRYFLHTLLLSSFIYLFIFQGGNVQHEYYQTIIFPPLAMFAGIGISYALKKRRDFISPFLIYPIIFFCLILSFSLSYYYKIKDFYTYPKDLMHMAKILDTFTKQSDKIITDRLGDTTLLYLADRRGSPMLYKDLNEMKNEGYSYYMTDKKEIISKLKQEGVFDILFENNQFVLFRL